MSFKYKYVGKGRVHLSGHAGFIQPDQEIESAVKISSSLFKSLIEEAVDKETKKEDTKKKEDK